MKIDRSIYSLVGVAALAVAALGMSSAAQAGDVTWSIGVGSPGVQLGASNAPQVFYRQPVYVPQPVYYGQPQVVYSQPQVTYVQPPVVYAPQPYFVQSGWAPPGYYRGWGQRGQRHDGGWNDEHQDRRDYQRQGDEHQGDDGDQ